MAKALGLGINYFTIATKETELKAKIVETTKSGKIHKF